MMQSVMRLLKNEMTKGRQHPRPRNCDGKGSNRDIMAYLP